MIGKPTSGPVPRRIAMVAACPFPSLRGSQVLIRELAQSLADRGHLLHLVTYPQGESVVALRGIRVHRVRSPRFATRPGGRGWRRLVLDLSLVRTLYRVVRRERIEVIHAHNYEAPLAGFFVRWLTGVPVVYHSHNALSDELAYYFAPGWRRRVARYFGGFLDRHVPRRADFSIALTPELETFLRGCGVPATSVATIAPTTAPSRLPANVSDGNGAFGERFVVMYTGNLDPYQDLDVLGAGIANLLITVPRTLLLVVTHEATWEQRVGARLLHLVEAGVARVIVAPAFSVVRRLMAQADVLVCPRRSWSGFPIKLVNYMASGRPVVAAEGSAKGVVDGETGLVFRNGDADALAGALRRLAHDPVLRARLGARARLAIGGAGAVDRNLAEIEAIYAHVCGGAAASHTVVPLAEQRWPQGLIAFSRDRISAASGEMGR
jgi:1,2-diacylglycerol 3-alpha-glucosyltransferase